MKDKEISVEIGNNILIFKTKLILSKESIEKVRKEIIEQIKSGIVVIDGRFKLDVIKKTKNQRKKGYKMLVEVKFKEEVETWDLSFDAIDIVKFDDEIEISFYTSKNNEENKIVTSKRIPKKIIDQLNIKF